MSGFMRKAALVVGAVALVATTAGLAAPAVAATATTAATAGGIAGISAATLAAIGTYGGLAAGVLSAISAATAPGISNQGSQTSFQTNPQSGLPYAMGRTRMSGLRIYADTNTRPGYTKFNDLLWFGAMLSIGGQIEQIEKFTVDNELVTFDGSGNAVGNYHDYMGQKLHMGGPQASALALTLVGGSAPGWTSQHRLSGITHAMWCLRYNKQGEMFGAGAPEPAWIGKWVRVYDPRLDSTYPGGSGPCRALNETTYVWSQNPGLHALTWALGRWQNGKRTCGIGAPVATIRVADFVECANVCDANQWKVGGVEWTTDSKWDTFKRILQAGGARPTKTGAMIGCIVSTPRTAVATIESWHLLDGLSIAATKSRRDRFNSVIPRYVDEDSDWSVISGKAITVPEYVTADRGQRTKEIDYPLVQVFSGEQAKQPGQLAAYDIVNSREAGPIDFTTGPEWIGLKTGDVVLLNVPEEGLDNQPILIVRRAPDPATGKVSFSAQTETMSKHPFALGQTTSPPTPFSLSAPDLKPPAPAETAWAVSGTTSGEGFPALIVTGESEMPSADAVVIDYKLSSDSEWSNSAILSAVEPVTHVIAPLESQTAYDIRIGYRVGTIDGNFTIFAAVVTGQGKITIIENQIADQDELLAQLATDTATALTNIAAAQTTITNMQADAAAVQAALTQAQNDILAAQDDILAQGGDIATIETTLGTQGASITSLQTTVSNHTGQLSTLTSTVSTQGATISANSTAITTLQGSVSSLSSTVSTQGASITALQTASTTQAGQLATLSIQVLAGNPNIAPNAGFDNGLAGWTVGGTAGAGWQVGFNDYGRYASHVVPFSGVAYLQSTDFITVRPNTPFTWTAESRLLGTGIDATASTQLGIIFYDSANNQVQYVTSASRPGPHNFTLDATARSVLTMTTTAPSTATKAKLRFIINLPTTPTSLDAGFRQGKFERGTVATAYSPEASLSQTFTAISTANSSIATLTTTVSTQGSSITTMETAITTLQGQTATLTTQVTAGNPNLLVNGGPENGTVGWSTGNDTLTSATAATGYGDYLRLTTTDGTGYVIPTTPIGVGVGVVYTFSADTALQGAGVTGETYCRVVVIWSGASGEISRSYGPIHTGGHTFSNTGANRQTYAFSVAAPSGATSCRPQWEVQSGTPGSTVTLDLRQMKVERGGVATAYSNETSVKQSFTTLSTLTTQYASLSSTVSTQGVTITSQQTAITTINGNITTLFGKVGLTISVDGFVSGWAMNNNGTVGDMIVDVDKFAVGRKVSGTNQFQYPFQMVGSTTYIKNAMIQDASITNAKIANLAIDTLKLANQAVTIPVGAYTAASMGFGEDVWTTIQSVGIISTGAPIYVQASCHMTQARSGGGANNQMRITRNGTVVYGPIDLPAGYSPSGTTFVGPISFAGMDQPGAGSFTYELQLYRDVGTLDMAHRSLSLTEFKK